MDKERFMAFPSEITNCLKKSGVEDVEFKTDFTDKLLKKPIHEYLEMIVDELTFNCRDKGAKKIIVSFSDNSLRVEDDVVEANPEETIMLLNAIINSEEMITTKNKQREDAGDCKGGGLGTKIIMGCLKKAGGNLIYSALDGRIIADATWE